MPRSARKQRAGRQGKAVGRPRALPPPEAVISVAEFTSPKSGKTYRAIETNETDAYDKKIAQSKGARSGRAKKKRAAGD